MRAITCAWASNTSTSKAIIPAPRPPGSTRGPVDRRSRSKRDTAIDHRHPEPPKPRGRVGGRERWRTAKDLLRRMVKKRKTFHAEARRRGEGAHGEFIDIFLLRDLLRVSASPRETPFVSIHYILLRRSFAVLHRSHPPDRPRGFGGSG